MSTSPSLALRSPSLQSISPPLPPQPVLSTCLPSIASHIRFHLTCPICCYITTIRIPFPPISPGSTTFTPPTFCGNPACALPFDLHNIEFKDDVEFDHLHFTCWACGETDKNCWVRDWDWSKCGACGYRGSSGSEDWQGRAAGGENLFSWWESCMEWEEEVDNVRWCLDREVRGYTIRWGIVMRKVPDDEGVVECWLDAEEAEGVEDL